MDAAPGRTPCPATVAGTAEDGFVTNKPPAPSQWTKRTLDVLRRQRGLLAELEVITVRHRRCIQCGDGEGLLLASDQRHACISQIVDLQRDLDMTVPRGSGEVQDLLEDATRRLANVLSGGGQSPALRFDGASEVARAYRIDATTNGRTIEQCA